VYANSLVNRFAYDDARIILDNTELHSLATLPGAVFKPYWHGNDGERAQIDSLAAQLTTQDSIGAGVD
jgi:hypothetical protein